MKIPTKKYLLLLAGFLAVATSCQQFLEREPRGTLTDTNFYKTEVEVFSAMIGVYSNLQRYGSYNMMIWAHGSATTDENNLACRECSSGVINTTQIANYNIAPDNKGAALAWESYFNMIYKANLILQRLPAATLISAPTKLRFEAEARYLRAMAYFDLVKFFGDLPILKQPVDAPVARSPKAEVYTFMEEDLRFAARYLPVASDIPTAEKGRATKGAAQGLLAKVFLFDRKWADAKAYSDSVITSGQYRLVDDYRDLYTIEGENGPESLFEVQFTSSAGQWSTQAEGAMQIDFQPSFYKGYNNVTSTPRLAAIFEKGDIRLNNTVIQVGDQLKGYPYPAPAAAATQYNMAKHWSTNNDGGDNDELNWGVLRLGEVLLINAEANIELNNLAAATAAINQIRKRAKLGPTPAVSQADLRDAVRRERRYELSLDGVYFYDLVRYGEYEPQTTSSGAVIQVLKGMAGVPKSDNFVKGRHELLPIPQTQIDLSGGVLIQNSGY